jgi:hypothetical protein
MRFVITRSISFLQDWFPLFRFWITP